MHVKPGITHQDLLSILSKHIMPTECKEISMIPIHSFNP